MHFYITSKRLQNMVFRLSLNVSFVTSATSRMYVAINGSVVIRHINLFVVGAGPMQAPGLFNAQDIRGKYGLVHNLGLGGAAVLSLLRRPEFYSPGGPDGRDR